MCVCVIMMRLYRPVCCATIPSKANSVSRMVRTTAIVLCTDAARSTQCMPWHSHSHTTHKFAPSRYTSFHDAHYCMHTHNTHTHTHTHVAHNVYHDRFYIRARDTSLCTCWRHEGSGASAHLDTNHARKSLLHLRIDDVSAPWTPKPTRNRT
jgi:hypothetical protein